MKNPIVITNSRIPKLLSWVISIRAITIYPFIIYRDVPDPRSLNHEKIHIRQQAELFVLPFYILYFWYWFVNRVWHRENGRDAYYNIPFEREAYDNDNDMSYLNNRQRFSWRKYFVARG